jgi:hypothetical protein
MKYDEYVNILKNDEKRLKRSTKYSNETTPQYLTRVEKLKKQHQEDREVSQTDNEKMIEFETMLSSMEIQLELMKKTLSKY